MVLFFAWAFIGAGRGGECVVEPVFSAELSFLVEGLVVAQWGAKVRRQRALGTLRGHLAGEAVVRLEVADGPRCGSSPLCAAVVLRLLRQGRRIRASWRFAEPVVPRCG